MLRRVFLTTMAAGVGGRTNASLSPPTAESKDGEYCAPDNFKLPEWMRHSRTVYFDGYSPPVYPHMRDFDARRLIDCVVALGADTLWMSSIGYYAYYPSKAYPPHPELGSRDLINEVSRECRRAGLHLYDYAGWGHPFMELSYAEKHPQYLEWVRRDWDGKPWGSITHVGWAHRFIMCSLCDSYRAAIRQVVKELSEHDISGIFVDGPWQHICFCDWCRGNYPKATGFDISRLRSEADIEARTAWLHWAERLAKEDFRDFRKILHGSGKFLLGGDECGEGSLYEAFSQAHITLLSGMSGASLTQGKGRIHQMWMGYYNLADWGTPVHMNGFRVHDTNMDAGDEVLMEGLANLAGGSLPVYCDANRLYFGLGDGSISPGHAVFELMRKHEPLMKDSVPVPYVTALARQDWLPAEQKEPHTFGRSMAQAFALAMLDSRISVDLCQMPVLTDDWLTGRRVIALCGTSGLSDEEASRIAKWVRQGGALLATYDAGLYDENGNIRKNGGALRDVLGVEIRGEPLSGLPENYYRVRTNHPALGQYGEGAVVMGDNRLVPAAVRGEGTILAECWNLGLDEVRGPAIVENQYGNGKALYVAGSLEANYVSSRVISLRRMLASMVRYLGAEAPVPFDISAPLGVYATLRRAANGDLLLWVLAPVGFKDASIGRMRQEYMPVSNVTVRILVPPGRKPKAMRLLYAGSSLSFSLSEGYAVAILPNLHVGEVVHLQLA